MGHGLSVTEVAHNRVIGILGTIIKEVLGLIRPCHRKYLTSFWSSYEKSRGLSAVLNISKEGEGKTPKISRRAMRTWNTAILLVSDAKLFGTHNLMKIIIIPFLIFFTFVCVNWLCVS